MHNVAKTMSSVSTRAIYFVAAASLYTSKCSNAPRPTDGECSTDHST